MTKVATAEQLAQKLTGLVDSLIDLEIEIKELAQREKVSVTKTKTSARRKVVDTAREDIAELESRLIPSVNYHVNNKKGVVTAVLTGTRDGSTLVGIARVSKDDKFDEHIGKAIALRRAARLIVPSEYTNAPQN